VTVVNELTIDQPVAPRRGSAGRSLSLWTLAAVALLAAALVLGASVGQAGWVWSADWRLVRDLRLPRVALAAIVGATLSMCSAGYQGVFRNPLVDTYQLGVAAGAGLGATLVIVSGRATTEGWLIDPLPLASFVFGLGAVALSYFAGAAFGSIRNTTSLVLAGVAVVSLLTAVQTYVLQRNTDVVEQVYTWILGSLNGSRWSDVRLILPYVVVSCVALFMHRRHLDVLRVGDDEAAALGINLGRVRLIVVVAATLGTAAAVSVTGLIGFVGLVVPHIVRLTVGSSYRVVMPFSALLGASFMVIADVIGRVALGGAELPIGVVTAVLGAPLFIVLLRTRRSLV
jgi:iron complex transport system permease protein